LLPFFAASIALTHEAAVHPRANLEANPHFLKGRNSES
jgi:hypothetical protein